MIKIEALPYGKRRQSEADREMDIEANLFALAIVIDEASLAKNMRIYAPDYLDLVDEPAIAELAKLYRVSQQLMTIRLCQLGYFEPYVKRT